jgi:endogenous inhibitor of DNA gyrase (YacG/DUF329 family)
MIDVGTFLDKNGLPSSRKLACQGVLEQLTELTPSFVGASAAERLYALANNLESRPSCPQCGSPTNWKSWSVGYRPYCSIKCGAIYRASQKPKKIKQKKALLTKEERVMRQERSNLARYGVRWPWMLKTVKEKKAKAGAVKLAEKWIEELRQNDLVPLFTSNEYIDNRQYLPVSCRKCGTEFELQRLRWVENKNKCPTCWTPRASKGQHELADWIKSLGIVYRINDRKIFNGKIELDIFIPDHNLVIEYDGLYWHSERGRPDIKQKSMSKFFALRERGLKHIMIFEDEWEKKRNIVQSRIKNALGLIGRKIAARKCELVSLSSEEQRRFFEENHMQGAVTCKEALGLRYEGQLVAAMSFGRNRFSGTYKWELLRFATKVDTSVVGAAGKLFSAWRQSHVGESIVTFSDNRWGTGSFYLNLGFKEDGQTGQGFFYVNSNGERRSRQQHMKHKLPMVLEKFDPSLTEHENCWNNGWYRVWDLGNTRWVIAS